MATSIIKVYNSRIGAWQANAKVAIGWNGFINLGMSETVYTNDSGIAIINHSAKGEAEVYVNGRRVGVMYTPGSTVIEID